MNNNWNRTGNQNQNSGKIAMMVPDRIIVRGHDQQIGTKALPREFELDSVAMSSYSASVKMQTPPRSIKVVETLNNYHHTVRDLESQSEQNLEPVYQSIVNHETTLLGDQELEHLRDQLSRINRRVLSLEEEMSDRKERERYFVIVGILYAALHAVTWFFRRGNNR